MDEKDYAGLLAQVIPVVILALLVATGGAHELRRRLHIPWSAGRVVRGLIVDAAILTALIFLEASALLTAGGVTWLQSCAGPEAGLAASVLLLVAVLMEVQSMSEAYRDDGRITGTSSNVVVGALWIILTGAIVGCAVAVWVLNFR